MNPNFFDRLVTLLLVPCLLSAYGRTGALAMEAGVFAETSRRSNAETIVLFSSMALALPDEAQPGGPHADVARQAKQLEMPGVSRKAKGSERGIGPYHLTKEKIQRVKEELKTTKMINEDEWSEKTLKILDRYLRGKFQLHRAAETIAESEHLFYGITRSWLVAVGIVARYNLPLRVISSLTTYLHAYLHDLVARGKATAEITSPFRSEEGTAFSRVRLHLHDYANRTIAAIKACDPSIRSEEFARRVLSETKDYSSGHKYVAPTAAFAISWDDRIDCLNVSDRLKVVFEINEIRIIRDLVYLTASELLTLEGFNPKNIKEIKKQLADHGFSLAKTNPINVFDIPSGRLKSAPAAFIRLCKQIAACYFSKVDGRRGVYNFGVFTDVELRYRTWLGGDPQYEAQFNLGNYKFQWIGETLIVRYFLAKKTLRAQELNLLYRRPNRLDFGVPANVIEICQSLGWPTDWVASPSKLECHMHRSDPQPDPLNARSQDVANAASAKPAQPAASGPHRRKTIEDRSS